MTEDITADTDEVLSVKEMADRFDQMETIIMPWRTDRPPNETWVEVRDGETIIEARAFYGGGRYTIHLP